MTGVRPAASRAWMSSLVMHTGVAFVAIVVALWPSSKQPAAGLPPFDTRVMDVSLVLLAPPSVEVAAPIAEPAPMPAVAVKPEESPSSHHSEIRPVAHQESEPSAATVATECADRPPAPASLPPGAITEFCGVPAVGSSVVFVIDRSGTMGLHGRLDRAKRELIASLHRLPETARFQIIAYHRRAEPQIGGGGLTAVSPPALARAMLAIERWNPEGGTDHATALRAALAMQPDVICFLTDDDDLTTDHVREITRLNRGRASIHALCFVEPSDESAMPLLAKQNRGVFRVVK